MDFFTAEYTENTKENQFSSVDMEQLGGKNKLSTNKTLMVIVTIFAFILFCYVLFYWLKVGNFSRLDTISIITLFFNFLMILLMLYTIHTGQEEVSRQISSYQKLSSEQITAIKEATTNEIHEMKQIEKRRKLISLLTLRKEIELNHVIIVGKIKDKKALIEGKNYRVDFFYNSAYNQGMIINCLINENLINKILLFYNDLNIANNFIEMAVNAQVLSALSNPTQAIKDHNKKIIEICKKNEPIATEILKELAIVKKKYRDQK